ncbi:MAG: hypothetical protein V9E95_13615 [Methanothrix soehngenii]
MDETSIGLHWLLSGVGEGRQANAGFTVRGYLQQNPDLKAAFGAASFKDAIIHFVTHGFAEGRKN